MIKTDNVRRAVMIPAMTIALSACSLSEPYTPPEAALPAQFSEGGGDSIANVAEVRWWEALRDRQLDGFVSRGLAQNLDIQAATERFNAAAAVAQGTGIAVGGGLNASGGVRGGSNDPEEEFAAGTVSVSWLADFFGLLSGQREVAAAELEAAGYGVEQTRLAFLAELSTAYVNARFFQNDLELTRQNLASRRTTLDLTQRLVDASVATTVDLQLARGLVDETRAQIPRQEAQFRIQSHRIATLLGAPASSLVPQMSRGAPQPIPRRIYSSGVPADLLRNRPDIRIAERRLAAAVARIGVARADLYPSISLTGRITGEAGGASLDETTWSFGPIVNLPIFGRRALEARVTEREALAREALAIWKNTVLRGVEEVENALVSLNRSRQTAEAEQRAVETLEEALRLAQESYSRGERSVLDVLDAERRVGAARSRFAQAQRQLAIDFISLNVAIGSGRGLSPSVEGEGTGES